MEMCGQCEATLGWGLNNETSSMLEFHPMISFRFCCSNQAFNGLKNVSSGSADIREVFPLVRILSS